MRPWFLTLCRYLPIGLGVFFLADLALLPRHRRAPPPSAPTVVQLPPSDVVGSVLLYRDGAAKLADVRLLRGFCWVAWYEHLDERVLLRPDGSAAEGILRYVWTLNVIGDVDRPRDRRWFDATCLDPADLTVEEEPSVQRLGGTSIELR